VVVGSASTWKYLLEEKVDAIVVASRRFRVTAYCAWPSEIKERKNKDNNQTTLPGKDKSIRLRLWP
jgi:hypothetical protein